MSNAEKLVEFLIRSSNATAGRATEAWLTGRGLAAEIESLRWATEGSPIPAPGLAEAVEQLSRSCSEACNRSDSLHLLGRGAFDDAVLASAEATSEALDLAAEETGLWMRRLAQLCLGVAVHLAGSDATAMAERAGVIALFSSGDRLVDDGLWIASRSMVEFRPELAGWLCRVCVEHDCRITIVGAVDPDAFAIAITVDEVGNLDISCSFADEALLPRAARRGWTQEGDVLVSRWLDPYSPSEVAGLLGDTLVGECEIASPVELSISISPTD